MKINPPKKGFIYVLEDKAYPGHIKIGYTANLDKRLTHINSNKPYKTARYIYSSEEQGDVICAYNTIMGHLIENHGVLSERRGLNKGWYLMSHKDLIEEAISSWLNNFNNGMLASALTGYGRIPMRDK